jgi:hypothetical protein
LLPAPRHGPWEPVINGPPTRLQAILLAATPRIAIPSQPRASAPQDMPPLPIPRPHLQRPTARTGPTARNAPAFRSRARPPVRPSLTPDGKPLPIIACHATES